MKIVFDPCESNSNKYVTIIADALRTEGFSIFSLSQAFRNPKLFMQINTFHLNWIENIFGKTKSALLVSFVKQYSKILFLKLFHKRIIWTMHNRLPHDKRLSSLKKILFRTIVKSADTIIVHCESSRSILEDLFSEKFKNIVYCPHPHYIGQYGSEIEDRALEKQAKMELLFLGAVKPYKNIELLIEVLRELDNPNINLTIAGKPETSSYGRYLESLTMDLTNVTMNLKFVEDDKIPTFLGNCDVLVLPYDMRSSLNSGSAIMAFSYKRTVICPKIGTIEDLPPRYEDKVFSYTHENHLQHKEALLKSISRAYEVHINCGLKSFGSCLFELMKEKNTPSTVAGTLIDIYTKRS